MRQKSAVLRSSCSFFSQLPAAPFSIGLCRRPRFPSGQAQADSNPRHRMGSTYVPRHRKSAPRHGGWWARHGGCGLCFGCAVGGWACVLLLSAQMAVVGTTGVKATQQLAMTNSSGECRVWRGQGRTGARVWLSHISAWTTEMEMQHRCAARRRGEATRTARGPNRGW